MEEFTVEKSHTIAIYVTGNRIWLSYQSSHWRKTIHVYFMSQIIFTEIQFGCSCQNVSVQSMPQIVFSWISPVSISLKCAWFSWTHKQNCHTAIITLTGIIVLELKVERNHLTVICATNHFRRCLVGIVMQELTFGETPYKCNLCQRTFYGNNICIIIQDPTLDNSNTLYLVSQNI